MSSALFASIRTRNASLKFINGALKAPFFLSCQFTLRYRTALLSARPDNCPLKNWPFFTFLPLGKNSYPLLIGRSLQSMVAR
ncbi:MAG TPA: hypothetical protein DDY57_11420 [Franconibacter pulveris]|nr:hypothetical protein [Franconibacter pulveris]